MNQLRGKIHPGLRGAFFYSAYWGAVGMYEPYLNIYFLGLGLSGSQIGWLAAVLPLCVVLITPLVTRLADRTHRRVAFLAACCLGFGLALIVPGIPGLKPAFPLLVGIVALWSVFRSPVNALADSLIAPMAVRYQLDFGGMRLWGSFIFTFTAIGMGAIYEKTGITTMFLVAAAAFLTVIFAALLLEEQRQDNPAELIADQPLPGDAAPATAAARRLPPVNPGLWFLLAATFLVIAALFMGGNFASIYMIELGGSPMMVGAVLGAGALGEVPGMFFGNRMSRRVGPTSTLLLAYALNAAGLLGYGLTHSPWAILVFSVIRGLGFGLVLVGNVTIINHHAPKEYASTFQGVFAAACYGVSPLLGGPISGMIYQYLGPSALFFTTGAMTLLAGLLILPTYKIWQRRPQGQPEPV